MKDMSVVASIRKCVELDKTVEISDDSSGKGIPRVTAT